MLPLVRRIVEDVVREHRRRTEKLVELDLLTTAATGTLPDPRIAALEREVQQLARDLEAFERELKELGILLKDPRMGLIDFPANLDGRRVLLCWHLGEPSVGFWHDESTGFAGRQPLSPTLVG
jgi:hypothetical protein